MICVIIVQNPSLTILTALFISSPTTFVISSQKTFAKSCFSIPHYHSPFFSDSFLFWYLTVVAPVHYFLTEKMHVSPSNFKGPWPPKPRLRVRPELRYNHIYFVLKRLSAGNDFPLSLQVIAAEGEQKASRALREASEIISESSSALQLRYLQASLEAHSVGKSLKKSPSLFLRFLTLCYYSKSQMFVQKFNFDKKTNIFTNFSSKFV